MANVFGWPDFDENGEKILTTYENEYKDKIGRASCRERV